MPPLIPLLTHLLPNIGDAVENSMSNLYKKRTHLQSARLILFILQIIIRSISAVYFKWQIFLALELYCDHILSS